MAQAPKTPPLRDPAEGKSPAIGGGHLTTHDQHPEHVELKRPIGVMGEPIDDAERDPGTIAEEQRRRSAEMEEKGVEPWKAEHDTRRAETPKLEGHKS